MIHTRYNYDKYELIYKVFIYSEAEKSRIEDLLLAAIRCGNSNVLETITYPIIDKKKLIEWKVREECPNNHVSN